MTHPIFPGLDLPEVLSGHWFSVLSEEQRAALAARSRDRFQAEVSACLTSRLSSGQRRTLNALTSPGQVRDRTTGADLVGFLRHAIPDLDERLEQIRRGIVIDLLSAAGDLAGPGTTTKE